MRVQSRRPPREFPFCWLVRAISLTAVICTPAAFAGLSPGERERVFQLLQEATTDGGVHLIETIIAGQAVLSEEELRSRYDGWQISLVPEPGATRTFVAKKRVA